MKRQRTNKEALKNEVNDLLTKPKAQERESVIILLVFNGNYKIDKYSLNRDPAFDDHYNFSMDTLTEKEARKLSQEPDILTVLFQNKKGKDPKWIKGVKRILKVPVNDSQLEPINNFFNHKFEVKVFPKQIHSQKEMESFMKWWQSDERKLWRGIAVIWEQWIEDLAEKRTGQPVFRFSKLG